uniref:Interleukin n=1 Tax=Steinernema glaseri TaxID=37863 RepID=A0A1I7ZMA0_9BILA
MRPSIFSPRSLAWPCPGFKNLTNEFRELILEVIQDDDEVKRSVPPVPEQPYEACPGFKNLTNEFRELILEVIQDDDEVKRCECKVPTPLKDFVVWLLNLLKTVLKYLAGGKTTVIPGVPPTGVPLPVRL